MLRWEMHAANQPLQRTSCEAPALQPDEVLVRVAGCGICHTDLGFLYGGVRTRKELPLALGHEISGVVEAAGVAARDWFGRAVVVPAVIPCGECAVCRKGRRTICPKQIFPGNDIHGGFASHVVVPARGLCRVPPSMSVPLHELAVLADAITTPYEAIRRSGLDAGDVAIFVGIGGVGSFGVQIAHALGAEVIAIDVDPERLELAAQHGASLTLDARAHEGNALRDAVRAHLRAAGKPLVEWRIFETSGTRAGQETAFRLLVHGAHLAVVGFTLDTVTVRLSNLMALDARAEGNWGCPPERYPEALALVERGQVVITPFVETRPLSHVNEALADLQAHRIKRRVVLVPDFN
jgi:6-hydroxycyclohex-1-ene-1-carbonyl-CoA dehydrogenase